ncbi:hypothetical protein [Actinoplanes philippinensis]|uniref:hypothetical protein n=1 Tax=Actinoplanes philippinensis TaxID=35752 RepID=UPI003402ACEC
MATLTSADLREMDRTTLHRLSDTLVNLKARGLISDEALHGRVAAELERRLVVGLRRRRTYAV